MLREIFRTEPLHYLTAATSGRHSYGLFGPYNEWIPEPHQEALSSLTGMYVHDTVDTLHSNHNIYVWMIISSKFWPGWGIALQRFDSVSGQWLQHVGVGSSIGSIFATDRVLRSRNGKLYTTNRGWELLNFVMDLKDETKGKEDPQPARQTYTGENIIPSHFEGVGSVFVSNVGGLGACLIDEPADTFIMGGDSLSVYFLNSGKHRWTVPLPAGTQNVCLEDKGRCYALCGNRELVLYDYVRNEVLGVSKVPRLGVAGAPVVIAWDWVQRRLLVCEQQPDLPTGYSQTRILGYRAVPEPVRITVPVPLRAPRRGRIVPVLAQVVGDMNEGVAGFPVNAVVTGDAALVGITLTDGLGRAVARVRCALPLPTTGGGTDPEIPSTIEELTYTTVDGSGAQPDIGYWAGDLYLVYVSGGNLVVQKNGMETYRIYMATAIQFGGQPYPRVLGKSCVFRNGTSAVSWEDLDMGPASWVSFLTAVWGDHPVVMNATMQGVQTTGYATRRRHRATGVIENVGMGNSHGLSRILSSGEMVLYDTDATRKDANGLVWGKNASFASSLIACEGVENRGIVVRMNDEASTELQLWPGETCLQPRIAVYQGDVTVVCTSGSVIKQAQFPVSMISGYVPGNAGGTATTTGGGTGAGTDPLAPVVGRDLWFGYFHQFSDRFGDNPNAPGNVTVVLDANKIAPALAAQKKLIVGDNAFRTTTGHESNILALFTAGNSVEELEANAALLLAKTPPSLSTKPILGMLNTPEMPTAAVAGVDWLGLVCYVKREETAFAAHARVQNALNALDTAHAAYFLIGQSYTANNDYTSSPQELVSAQYLPANIAKADTRVTGILMYSDGQPSGTRDHEQWRPIHAAIFAGIGEDGVETPIGAYDGPPGTFHIKMEVTMAEPPLTPQSVGVPGTGGGGAGGGGGDSGGSASAGHPWMDVGGTPLDYKGVSGFALFIRWLDGDTGATTALCAWAKAEGYTVIRVLGMFGHPLWVDHGFDYYPGDGSHSESAYYSGLTAFANHIVAQGLALEWSAFADVGYISKYDDPANRLAHIASCTTALLGIGPVVIEICNEPPFNGLASASDLKVLADKVKEVDPSRKVALGSESGGAWDQMTYAIAPTDYLTFHGNRSDTWSWVTQYWGSNVLKQSDRFPIEDEPQHPEDDPEEGRFFALGCLSRILEFGVTFHFSEGLWGDVPAGHAAVCGEAMAEGLNLATYGFGGELFKDFEAGSPLQSTSANPQQVVGRKTAGSMQLIAMGCPAGWTPQYAGGWVQTAITKRGTGDNAQFMTATLSSGGGTGGSTATAPNMLERLNLTYASRTWRFNQGAEYDATAADGRGAYIHAAVTDLHGLNANWGHIRVLSSLGYHSHSVDSIAWKRPDATAVEIYKVISGAGVIQWVFVSAFESDLANWFYDA